MHNRLTLRTLLTTTAFAVAMAAVGETLTIIHTNDTHSQIDPTSKDLGGVLRRQVVIDSIRAEHTGAILVDAGDMVQGTLFFTLYGGQAERDMMNALGYDIQILGNHEFDNGLDSIAAIYRGLNADKITTNYDVRGTALEGLMKPYVIRTVGDKKVAFIGINLDPKGMIADKNYTGLKYLDAVKAANSTAWHLKHNEGVDRVVAVTHIGYVADKGITDPELVKASEDIDLVIGGHSHTLIDGKDASISPYVANLKGDSILITQTGKSGLWVGEVTLDLDNGHATEKLIRVDKRLDDRINPATAKLIEPYRKGVDSLMNVRIGTTAEAYPLEKTGLVNLASDMVLTIGRELTGKPMDLSIMNIGGVRSGWTKGALTKGQVINTFPFDNRVRVLEIKGSDLREAFDVMAARGGDGVSANVDAAYDPATGKCTSITINGKPLDDDATYLLATIDYLANGGDYMSSLTRAKTLATSDVVLYDDFIRLISTPPMKGMKLQPDDTRRMHPAD